MTDIRDEVYDCQWCGVPLTPDDGVWTEHQGTGDYCPEGLAVGSNGTSPHLPVARGLTLVREGELELPEPDFLLIDYRVSERSRRRLAEREHADWHHAHPDRVCARQPEDQPMNRTILRAICKVLGHVPRQGRNGWQNLGTGWFCQRCSTEVKPPRQPQERSGE